MLTKTDLSEIRGVIKNEIQTETPKIVRQVLQTELKPIKKSLNKIEKRLDETIEFFDNEVTFVKKRVDRVEDNLNLPRLDPLEV
jgi:predicted nuclease with TOPRIM domain